MPDIEKILRDLLSDRRLRESATFSSRTYADQPIIQTGKQLRERSERTTTRLSNLPHTDYTPERPAKENPPRVRQQRPVQPHLPLHHTPAPHQQPDPASQLPIPERYYQLRDLAHDQPSTGSASWRGALAYGSRPANRLFYEQARLMEDFEDDYDFHGTYFQYFPTYSSMTLSQLRGYFSWRTRVRHGEMPEAPLSFAFLHVYELLCGIGTTPGEQGFADLVAFRDAFGKTDAAHDSTFRSYLKRWLGDYVIYHGLDPALLPDATGSIQSHVFTLLQAEDASLVSQGLSRKAAPLTDSASPNDEALLTALNECSSYKICGARLYKTNPDDVRFVARDTFKALVTHCSRRRKTDFVEGLFGTAYTEPYTMFSSAIFYEPTPHADATVRLSPIESYTCKDGRWRRSLLCDASARSSQLGSILHAVDATLRDRLDYPYPLKHRTTPAYVSKIINKAIDDLLAKKEEEERRRINIDLSQLNRIRSVAAETQEALLTEEEREDVPTEAGNGTDTSERALSTAPWHDASEGVSVPSPASADTDAAHLSTDEVQVLRALLNDEVVPSNPGGTLLSLVVDSINEKLFDLVGDTVIEFVGDEPILIEDYVEDVREIVGE